MKKILCPVDFSDNSLNALDYALEFCLRSGADLLILHAYEVPYDAGNRLMEKEEEIRGKAIDSMDQLVNSIYENSDFSQIECETIVAGGSALKNILDFSQKYQVELIVMGTKGRSDLKNVIFGSTTSSVAVKAGCQVLAVPDGVTYSDVKQLMYTTDLREDDLPIIQLMLETAEFLEARLNLLYLHGKKSLQDELLFRGFREMVRERHPSADIHFEMVQGESFADLSEELAGRYEGMLLAVGYYRNRFLEMLSNREDVRELANHTRIPLLVMPHPEQVAVEDSE